jgi:hypothetical protein
MIKLLIKLLFPKVYEEIGREFSRREALETERHFENMRSLYVREKKVN